jgi:hypothetical protein
MAEAAMRRSARQAEILTEFVSLLAREVQHRLRVSGRRSQTAIAAEVLDGLIMPDLAPALAQLRELAIIRSADKPAKPPRKRPGRVIMLDQPA